MVAVLKSKITLEDAITRREFCQLLEVNYDTIIEERKSDQLPNLTYWDETSCYA